MAVLSALALVSLTATAALADTDTLTINFEVRAINVLEITADSVTLVVDTAVAGQQPDPATASTTYAVTTNTGGKITGHLEDPIAGLTLSVWAHMPPEGGHSEGFRNITNTTPGSTRDLVTGVNRIALSNLDLQFVLSADVDAGVVAAESRTFTMTMVDGS